MEKEPRKIEDGSFAEACYNQNTIEDLKDALKDGPDRREMREWNLSESEYMEQIEIALENLINDKMVTFDEVLQEWEDEFGEKYVIKNKSKLEKDFEKLQKKYPGQSAFWYADTLMNN